MADRLKVMMTTEGTYPFHQGGVSSWCDMLVNKLDSQVDYTIFTIIMNPFVSQKFKLPSNVKLIKVPLWGTEEPSEHLDIPFSQVYVAKEYTTDSVVEQRFIPIFHELMDEILKEEKSPERFGDIIIRMYRFFREFEYKKAFKAQAVWNYYKKLINDLATSEKIPEPDVYSLIQSLGWVYRFFNIINTPMPSVHVTHSAAAAFCGIPCVLAKLLSGTPYLLTEHGVYMREQYLALAKRNYSSFLNMFLIRLIKSVVTVNYHYADQVSPVCSYNARWERKLGVPADKVEVIYNGVDKNMFAPSKEFKIRKSPTIVSVARIDPVKDIKTLLRAAAVVIRTTPSARFMVYGSVTVPDYFEECKKLKRELGLGSSFVFAGHLDNIRKAYADGDIIVLSSITEAFPYSVVEAMMSGKPVVATDVGGIKEALDDGGIVVQPQNPELLGNAILKLLDNPDLRAEMGRESRERALNFFTTGRFLSMYLKSYLKLSVGVRTGFVADSGQTAIQTQDNLFEDGVALIEEGKPKEAVENLRSAIDMAPSSPAVPAIMTQIARAYNSMGEFENAFYELEKAEMLHKIISGKKVQLAGGGKDAF